MSMDIYGDVFGSMGAMTGDEAAFFGGFMIVWLVVVLLSNLFGILSYVLQSVGMYRIAQRRGIHNPWLAWIPVASMWTLGSIADQYQYVAKGKVRSYRKILLGLNIAMAASTVVLMALAFAVGFSAGVADTAVGAAGSMVAPALALVVVYLALFAVAIVLAVYQYIALYNLFASCDTNNAVVFLVLGIFFNVTLPFFIFAVRKKDQGMPPRRQPPVQPEHISAAEPVEEPVVEAEVVEEPITAEDPARDVVEAEPEDFVD